MAAKTTYLKNRVLEVALKGVVSPAWATTTYAALFTDDPTVAGLLTNEVSGTGTAYTRAAITWGTASLGSISNSSVAVTFPTCAGSAWGTVTYVGIMDIDTLGAGNMLYYGQLGTSKAVGVGDAVSFAINALTVTEA